MKATARSPRKLVRTSEVYMIEPVVELPKAKESFRKSETIWMMKITTKALMMVMLSELPIQSTSRVIPGMIVDLHEIGCP